MSTPTTVPSTTAPAAPVMAGVDPLATPVGRLPFVSQLRGNPRLPALLAAAIAIALIAVLVLWSRTPDYKVLYSNLSDRDGGSIIAALQQMNVPYKFSEGGGAILVPADAVDEARLRLAQQGLPKGGSVGFELMDNEKFGISEFAEQINYQRALEGELERTIGSIASVQSARVHLAIPKPSVFVRDRQNPSASVLVNLYPGRTLDDGQVAAITHMVAAGVPDMPVKNVTVVDQNGDLLTSAPAANGLDASQLKYVKQIEHDTQQRIAAILAPLFGADNVHAQVSADVDFSQVEQTAENYQPNPTPAEATIRSQQTNESSDAANAPLGGVPGALSNTPPAPASAPIVRAASAATAAAASGASSTVPTGPLSTRKDVTTNYEVDRTIRHVQEAVGSIKRLSVAVVINYRREVDAHGHATMHPLPADQLAQVQSLVRDAMGYDAKRGDTLNVVNSAFSDADVQAAPALPLWKQPDMIELAKTVGKYVLIGAVALYLFFAVLRPAMKKLLAAADRPAALPQPAAPAFGFDPAAMGNDKEANALPDPAQTKFDKNLEFARQIAKQDPKLVATVVKSWVSDER